MAAPIAPATAPTRWAVRLVSFMVASVLVGRSKHP
jgi:hypothetical protein